MNLHELQHGPPKHTVMRVGAGAHAGLLGIGTIRRGPAGMAAEPAAAVTAVAAAAVPRHTEVAAAARV